MCVTERRFQGFSELFQEVPGFSAAYRGVLGDSGVSQMHYMGFRGGLRELAVFENTFLNTALK